MVAIDRLMCLHISKTPSILDAYQKMFEALITTRESRGPTKTFINNNNVLPNFPERFAGFSPRSKFADIELMASLISGAKQDVMFATAFKLREEISSALLGSPNDNILRMGIQNSTSSTITGTHRDRTAQFYGSISITWWIGRLVERNLG